MLTPPHLQTFIDYYHRHFWATPESSSGPNSALRTTPLLREGLRALIDRLAPQSILDLGCGDANLFTELPLEGITYTGWDCVPALIEATQARFSDRWNFLFQCRDILNTPIPSSDLVICRDVTHYLPNPLIDQLLSHILASQSKSLLITHNLYSSASANDHTEIGLFRPVNLTYPPFNWPEPIEIIQEDVYGKALGLWSLEAL
jgi:SAM-dependent methyltransferase